MGGAEAAGGLHRILHRTTSPGSRSCPPVSSSAKVSHTTRRRKGGERGRCGGAGVMWACGCVESRRGGEAVGGLHRILHPDHFTRIPLLSSRVLLHQGVPYHPAQERRGAGEVRWKGDDASRMWVCGCVGRVWEMRMRRASPRSGAFWCERSGREERREEPGRLVHAWCDLLRISWIYLYTYT